MLRYLLYIYVSLCVALGLVSCVSDDKTDYGPSVAVGERLPSFRVLLNDGSEVSDQSLHGKPGVVVLFTTTCPDCRRAMPGIEEVYSAWKTQARFVCIGREEPASKVAAYWNEQGYSMPWSAQEDRTVYELFASRYVPRVFVFDAQGTVRASFVEEVDTAQLQQALRRCIE